MTAAALDEDSLHMRRALHLAAFGLYTTDPNPRVGCVLVRGKEVVGEGWHERAGREHAEVLALRAAGARAHGATAYVTLEPCSHTGRTPPCANALITAGVARVVAACSDPNPLVAGSGLERLRAAGIAVSVGTEAIAARKLNVGFFSRFERGRPFVRLKLAMSIDARTALAGGESKWITGTAARNDVQEFRARSSAICTGAGTVRADDPRLDVRLDYGPWVRQPLRVVLDSQLSCADDARVFRDVNVLVFAAEGATPARAQHARIKFLANTGGHPDLKGVLEHLAVLQVNELLVECGPRLAASFLEQQFVDELLIYLAPVMFGADARPMTALTGVSSIDAAPRFEILDVRAIAEDLRLILKPRYL